MDYFQPSAVDDATKPAAKANEEDRLRTASENSSDGNPFSFNASSMKPSAASHDLHSSDAVTGADHSSARSAARGPQTTQQEHPPTGGVSSSNGGSSNIGFREALMRRQGSSPSSFFAVAQTPGVMAHPLRASASSSGVDDAKTSSTSTSRWQKEMSSSSRSATHEGPAVGDSATHPPKLSGASPNWIGKSPRDSPAGRPSDAKGSTTTNGETSLTSSPFFNKPYDTPSSMAASTLHRSATNFTDAGRIESPRDIEERNSTTSAFQRRPPPKTLSSSSSTSTVTPKTTREGASQAGSSPPAANPAFSSSSTDTTVKTSSSTSPIEAPPPTKSSQMQQITSSSTSNSSPTKQHSCPLPSLRLPFMGGGGAAGKLPSGACASLPSKMSSFGARTGISRAFGGGAGSRKGPDIVQNPKFKTVTVGRELRDMLQGNHTASLKGDHSPSRSVRNAEVLILDLRPHTAFVAQGRLRHSVNICVPSTLLRRPNFALDKIAETISSRRDQSHFNRILNCAGDSDKGKGTRVILLDQETLLLSQDSMIHSLMSKIDKAGYEGEIAWVKGGWNAIQNFVEEGSASSGEEADLSAAVDMDILNEEDDEEEDEEMLEQRDGEIEEESESADDLAGSENSDIQDTRTPRQPFPSAVAGNGTFESASNGAGGAYFQNYLQGSRNIAGKGRSSQSSFTSTASSDSLFPSSVASSQSSMGSAMDRGNSTSPVTPHFDSSKLQLPQLRPSTSPAHSISSSSSAASFPAVKSRTLLSASTSGTASSSSSKTRSTSAGGGCSIVKPKNLPMAAFQYNSTAQAASGESPQKSLAGSGRPATSTGKGQFQMGLDNDNANIGRMPGSSGMEKSKSATRAPFGRKTAANPFFDNIRQNIESQSIDHVLEHVAPLEIPPEFTKDTIIKHLPKFLKSLIDMAPKERAEKLHKEYFDIEQAEQRRLQRVLDWHCQQSVVVDLTKAEKDKQKASEDTKAGKDDRHEDATYHPFSISAGVEKGHLNRYKNMWPYEHARVRLDSILSPTCGDYINASHIQLRGTSKRYIASQGPLEQTTEHFWRLVLQENVHVIVMLTLLQEGGREKCSNYFQTATYGDIQVTLVEEKGSEDAMKKSVCKDFGFFSMDEQAPKVDSPASSEPAPQGHGDAGSKQTPFYASTPTQASDSVSMKRYSVQTPSGHSQMQGHKRSLSRRLDSAIVRRTIELRRKSDPPNTPPKVVRHIQYIKWPDFDIPPDPNVVIDLISETNRAQRDLADLAGVESPVLVHCSAGVGRTGTFIAVDTLLERYRRERRDARTAGSPSNGPPRARVRRSGSDLGSSLPLQDLSLTEDDVVSTTSSPAKSETHVTRPPAIRSASSQESPRHLQARLGVKELLPEDHSDPILSLVNQMREQRMSSVANAGQYIFTYLALLAGITQELAEEGITAVSPVS